MPAYPVPAFMNAAVAVTRDDPPWTDTKVPRSEYAVWNVEKYNDVAATASASVLRPCFLIQAAVDRRMR